MKRVLMAVLVAALGLPAGAQSFVYSRPFISKKSHKVQGVNVPLHKILVVKDRVHVWEYGGKDLELTVCDGQLSPVRQLALPEEIEPGTDQLSFVQLQGFYYLFVTRVDAVAVYRCDDAGNVEPVTQRLQQGLGRRFGAQQFTVHPAANKLFFVQVSGGSPATTEYTVYLADSSLEVTHKQVITVADSVQNVSFDAFNDSLFLVKQLTQVAGESSALVVTRLNIKSGEEAHIRLASQDSYFMNSLTFPGKAGGLLLLNELMLFRNEEQGGLQTRYSYLATIGPDWKVRHTLPLSNQALDDSLQLDGMGFMNMYTGFNPEGHLVHVDFAASVRRSYREQEDGPTGRAFGASHLRVSVMDSALGGLRSVYQKFPPGLFPVLRTTGSNRLLFFCTDLKSRSVSWGYEADGNGFREFDLGLNAGYRYFFEAAQPIGPNSFVVPYLDKDFGLVLINLDEVKYLPAAARP